MLGFSESKDSVIRHLKYQINEIQKINNASLYTHFKAYIDAYIKKIEFVIKDIETIPQEHVSMLEFDHYGISFGYNNNNFVADMRKCYAENNFTKNCVNIIRMFMHHQIGKYDFSEQEEKFLEKFFLYVSDNNDYEKFIENLKLEANKHVDDKDTDEELEIIEWIMYFFWDKVLTEEELLYMVKNSEDIEEEYLIGEEQIKKDNAFNFYINCSNDESLTHEQYKYALNLRTITEMYRENTDLAIDEKYMRELYHLVTRKKYSKEDILELIKNSTVEDRLRAYLTLEMNNSKTKLNKLEEDSSNRNWGNEEDCTLMLNWQFSFSKSIGSMADALDMLGKI